MYEWTFAVIILSTAITLMHMSLLRRLVIITASRHKAFWEKYDMETQEAFSSMLFSPGSELRFLKDVSGLKDIVLSRWVRNIRLLWALSLALLIGYSIAVLWIITSVMQA